MAAKKTTVKDLQAGDVVGLKSSSFKKGELSGLKMTIEKIKDGYATCVWFSFDGFRREQIETSALKKV